jgi:hypothetical protein
MRNLINIERQRSLLWGPNIIRMITARRMRWEEHVARMGEMRNAYKILVRKPEAKRALGEDLDLDGSIILKWILGKYGWRVWTGFIWLRIGTGGRLLSTRQ